MRKATLKVGLFGEIKKKVLIPTGGEYHDPRPNGRLHDGIDFAIVIGTRVYALIDGLIENKRFGDQLEVWITKLDGSEQHRNVHLSAYAKPNGRIKIGELIGYTGDTGVAGRPHLHFERKLFVNGQWVAINPTPYLLEENTMVGKPTPSVGQVVCAGSPELINDAGDKSGTFAGFDAVVPFDAIRGGKFDTPKGNIEYRNTYKDKGIVWVHCNDVQTNLTISGHVEPERVIAEQKELGQQIVDAK